MVYCLQVLAELENCASSGRGSRLDCVPAFNCTPPCLEPFCHFVMRKYMACPSMLTGPQERNQPKTGMSLYLAHDLPQAQGTHAVCQTVASFQLLQIARQDHFQNIRGNSLAPLTWEDVSCNAPPNRQTTNCPPLLLKHQRCHEQMSQELDSF